MLTPTVRRTLITLAPLLVLGADLLRAPLLLESSAHRTHASIISVLTEQHLLLGTVAGHRIHVSLDDLASAQELESLQSTTSALLISAFADEDGKTSGALLRLVLQKLKTVSPNDHVAVTQRLDPRNDIRPLQLLPFRLSTSHDHRSAFPIDRLYVLILTQGEAAAPQDLSKALRRTFAIAAADGVSSLVVPCIGTNWEYNHSLSFDVFFGAFFEALPSGSVPRDVWLSLYAEWPTFHLEAAMASLNAHWEALFQAPQTVFYHRDSRLALVFLSLCLFVCSGQAPPTAKNVLIIAASFVASATAANSTVASLAQTYGETVAMVAQIAVLAFLAVLFPLIVHWNPKDLFKAPNTDKPDTGSRQ